MLRRGASLFPGQTIFFKNLSDFFHLFVRYLSDFAFLAFAFLRVVLRIAFCCEIAAQSHRY